MVTAGVLAAGLYLLPLAVGVAGCVAGERHRGTLDPLLATPLGRRGVLFSKVRAHAEQGLVFAVGAATAVGCGFGADGGLRLGAAAIAALLGGFALVVTLAAWLSVRCETPVRAFRLALPAVVLVIGLPALVRNWIAWESVGDAVAVLGWAAGLFAAAAAVLWWRAGAELSRGAVG
jgi:ABC-type Na+ efflux pump permease subunit